MIAEIKQILLTFNKSATLVKVVVGWSERQRTPTTAIKLE